jgi:hypothetical protein
MFLVWGGIVRANATLSILKRMIWLGILFACGTICVWRSLRRLGWITVESPCSRVTMHPTVFVHFLASARRLIIVVEIFNNWRV